MSFIFPMSPMKRRLMENWLSKVDKCLEDGTICTNVISVIDHDPQDTQIAVRPVDDNISAEVRPKSRQRRELKTPELEDEKNHCRNTFPNVNFKNSYAAELKRKSRKLLEGMNVIKNIDQTRNDDKDITRNAALVIVDPQLLTPQTDLNNLVPIIRSRSKLDEKAEDRIAKYDSLKVQIREMQAQRLTSKEIFARCKVQSHDKDSFVISRSNIKIKDCDKRQLTNHSFLALPLRFQLDSHRKRAAPREKVNNIPGNNQELVDTPRRRAEAANPKLIQTAVWAW